MTLFWKVENFIVSSGQDVRDGKSSSIFGFSDGKGLWTLADSKRVEVGLEVTSDLVGSDEVFKGDVLFHVFADVARGFRGASDGSFDFVNSSGGNGRGRL